MVDKWLEEYHQEHPNEQLPGPGPMKNFLAWVWEKKAVEFVKMGLFG